MFDYPIKNILKKRKKRLNMIKVRNLYIFKYQIVVKKSEINLKYYIKIIY